MEDVVLPKLDCSGGMVDGHGSGSLALGLS